MILKIRKRKLLNIGGSSNSNNSIVNIGGIGITKNDNFSLVVSNTILSRLDNTNEVKFTILNKKLTNFIIEFEVLYEYKFKTLLTSPQLIAFFL